MSVVEVVQAPKIWTVSLNRPERLNALGEEVRVQLHEVVRQLAERPGVAVLVIRGEGRAFSAGADLRDPLPQPEGWADRRYVGGAWQRLLDDLEALPQVTVAALHGRVVGGAALLGVSCDLRVAASDLAFSIPEVRLGIPLTWAGLPRLVREIGLPRTRDLVMTGRVVGADEAVLWGLVQRVAPVDDLDGEVGRLVATLVDMPPGPLAMTRRALAAIGREISGFGVAWADPDLLMWALRDTEAQQAMSAYLAEQLPRSDPR